MSVGEFAVGMKDQDVDGLFAFQLRVMREDYGITQGELAQASGISLAVIQDLECAAASATLPQLFLLAKAFGVPVSFLIPNEFLMLREAEAQEREFLAAAGFPVSNSVSGREYDGDLQRAAEVSLDQARTAKNRRREEKGHKHREVRSYYRPTTDIPDHPSCPSGQVHNISGECSCGAVTYRCLDRSKHWIFPDGDAVVERVRDEQLPEETALAEEGRACES